MASAWMPVEAPIKSVEGERRLDRYRAVINQFQARANYPRHAVAELKASGVPVLEPYISMSVKVRESHGASKPLVLMYPSHKVSREFKSLYASLSGDGERHLESVA